MQPNGSGNGSRLPAIAPKPPPNPVPSQELSLPQETGLSPAQIQMMQMMAQQLMQQQVPAQVQILAATPAMTFVTDFLARQNESMSQLAQNLGKLVQQEGEYYSDQVSFKFSYKERQS